LPLDTNSPGPSRVAEKTACAGSTAVAVRATEPGIDRYFVNTATETLFEVLGKKLIWLHRLDQLAYGVVVDVEKAQPSKTNLYTAG
jgi:hypothetical protein